MHEYLFGYHFQSEYGPGFGSVVLSFTLPFRSQDKDLAISRIRDASGDQSMSVAILAVSKLGV